MRVLMIPSLSNFDKEESGIKRVVEAYTKYSSQFGIEYVGADQDYDLTAIHAGMSTRFDTAKPLVAMIHGLYWTNDYPSDSWEWRSNSKVVYTARCATRITVPSEWVAETFRRDMHVSPAVIHHGIDWQDWQHNQVNAGYVLWNKNRAGVDVCDPSIIKPLAEHARDITFVTTFAPPGSPANVKESGLRHHDEMKIMVQSAGVYISTAKETFGIGALEALASGTPVVGFAYGGNLITVKHGVNGYLAKPGDADDLLNGIRYCLQNRDILSANAKLSVKEFTWEKAVEKVANVYQDAINVFNDKEATQAMNGDQSVKVHVREIGFYLKQGDDPDEVFKKCKADLIRSFADALEKGHVGSPRKYPDGRRELIPKDNMMEYTIKFDVETSGYDHKVVMRVYTI